MLIYKFKRGLAITLFFILSACTLNNIQKIENITTDYNTKAIKTFSIGFQQISERYIIETKMDQLIVRGLRGLKAIDQGFTINLTNNGFKIILNSEIQSDYFFPTSDNYSKWAELVVRVISLLKKQSNLFKNTPIEQFYEIIFDSILSELDTHSRYNNARTAQANNKRRSGFGGIGVQFKPVKTGVKIIRILSKTPADKLGLIAGDIITFANKQTLTGMSVTAVKNIFRDEVGSILDIKVLRQEKNKVNSLKFKTYNFSIKREQIVEPTINYSSKKGIIYIKLLGFNNKTSEHLRLIIRKLLSRFQKKLNQNPKGIILDLRDNSGGILTEAVAVADLFLNNGKIISTKGRNISSYHNYKSIVKDITNGLPLIVLINGKSASASEIVAVALQDNKRAIVIGSSSFGKGTVQTIIKLPNGGEIILTWSRFQSPLGYYIDKLGVYPTICTSKYKLNEPINYIKNAIKKPKPLPNLLKFWKDTTYNRQRKIKQLRNFCPAAENLNKMDTNLAETLLLDPILYRKLNLTLHL